MPTDPNAWSDKAKWIMGIVSALIVTVACTFLIAPFRDLIFPPGPAVYDETPAATTIQVTASLKSFDILAESVGSPEIVELAPVPLADIDDVIENKLWSQMREIIVPADLPETKTLQLEIKDGQLHAAEPLVAHFELRYQTPAQNPMPQRELGENTAVALIEAFSLTKNPYGQSQDDLRIQLAHKSGRYHRAHIVVSGAPSYAFQPNSTASTSAKLRLRPTRILIANATSTGLKSHVTEAALLQFKNTLAKTVGSDDTIQLVGFTLEELRAKRNALKALQWSEGKVDMIEEFAVDYIVEPTLLFQ